VLSTLANLRAELRVFLKDRVPASTPEALTPSGFPKSEAGERLVFVGKKLYRIYLIDVI
jgi:hypothetical protein